MTTESHSGEDTWNASKKEPVSTSDFSHTIFAEYTTATWCPYCPYAHTALKNIYANGWYPIYYVSMIIDKNTHAYERAIGDFNIYYIPTTFFDGGYNVYVGGDPGGITQDAYNESITSCGDRQVADIDMNLSVMWLENSTMKIEMLIRNNEPLDYEGYLKVYVTERTSSMDWRGVDNEPYTFAFLDYAFNQSVLVRAKQTWENISVWNGNDYSDGYGNDFGGITHDNIMVIAALFNPEKHQGYAVPPSEAPFDAYYVDDTTAAIPSVDLTPPDLELILPKEGYLHLFGRAIIPIGFTLVLGKVTVTANAADAETGIGTVEFYIDDELQQTDSSPPYEWLLDYTIFFKHTLKILAKNLAGNVASVERTLWIINV